MQRVRRVRRASSGLFHRRLVETSSVRRAGNAKAASRCDSVGTIGETPERQAIAVLVGRVRIRFMHWFMGSLDLGRANQADVNREQRKWSSHVVDVERGKRYLFRGEAWLPDRKVEVSRHVGNGTLEMWDTTCDSPGKTWILFRRK